MTTPTSTESRLHARGYKKASAWGTEVALGAGDEVLTVHPGATGLDVPEIPTDPALESDTAYVKKYELLQTPPQDIVIQSRLRYEMGRLGTIIAQIFGTAGAPTQQGATAAYKHVFQWADEIEGEFGTWVEERPSKIFVAPAAKPFRLELNFANGIFMANVSLRCDDCIETSTTNTATQIDALTLPSTFYNAGVQAMFSHASVKINDQSGGDVASESALTLDDFSIVFERPMEAGKHVAGSATIIEPLEGGLSGPDTVVNLMFPRSASENQGFFAKFRAGTVQKLKIQLTGSNIESTYDHDFSFFLPGMKPARPDYTVEEIVRAGLVLKAVQAASNPTGMDYTRPYAEIINQLTTDYLA